MKTYKLRAECVSDITHFMLTMFRSFNKMGSFTVIPVVRKNLRLPDCVLEFDSEASLEQIKEIITRAPDTHVMLETVQLKENYTGER